MILSAREYAKKFGCNCSAKTIIRKAQNGLLPSNHLAKKVGRDWIIEVGELDHLKDFRITLSPKAKQ